VQRGEDHAPNWTESLPWGPKNLLAPYLLFALSAYQVHGYLLERYLRSLGFISTNITTIYRTLRQLEREGLVSSYWQPTEKGPAQRIYTLTDAGHAYVRDWTALLQGYVLESYRAMMDAFFRMYGLGAAPHAGEHRPSGRSRSAPAPERDDE